MNLVKANWAPMSESLLAAGHFLEYLGQTYELIEGCSKEDVGWMRLASDKFRSGLL